MSKVMKTGEYECDNLVHSEYCINWKCVLTKMPEAKKLSSIDLEKMYRQEAWTRFLADLGIYSIRKDLHALGHLIQDAEACEIHNRVMQQIDAMHNELGVVWDE